MNISSFLLGMAGPLAVRVLLALGFTAVSFAGVTVALNQLMTIAKDNWASMPVDVLAIASLSGIPQALGMIASAYAARVAVWVTQNATKYVVGAR